ncbi:putative galactolipase [Rosa chinensis]|uniref:Patatin n=1 Tax=Rosa chinensis TaxID=74649 RepID=A0A2P6Q0A9_ROSCH|nr:putative galactolipase [Rosa chinensis]PRQ27627.1 putative galactolipase [Rosa chinensis]
MCLCLNLWGGQVKNKPSFDALLSDICIATSVAPTYLPAHYFETNGLKGKVREFHLIDGGLAANNPTLIAIGEVTLVKGSSDFFTIKPMDRTMVISLGTGSSKAELKYNAHVASKWGVWNWLTSGGSTSLINAFSQASAADMVDLHLSVVFKALHSEKNYLRIQLRGLLRQPVSRVNVEIGRFEACNHETNKEALIRFAKLLSEEKWLRLARSPHGHIAKSH